MNMHVDQIATVWRVPFSSGAANVMRVAPGSSLLDIISLADSLPASFMSLGSICINGDVVPREYWRSVRPKARIGDTPIIVTLHLPMQGGGGGSGGGRSAGKQIAALVASIALAAVSFGIATFGIPGLVAAGSFGAKVLATTVALAGSLALSALSAPPTRKASGAQDDTQERGPASASGNVLQPGAFIPRVIGTRKIFPPLVSQPLVDLVGDDEFVEAMYALAGEHEITDLRIGDGSIETSEDVEYQTREGWDDDAAIDLFSRYGVSQTPQLELSAHDVDEDNQDRLADQANPANSLPVWHSFATRSEPQEIWLHVAFAEGIADQNAVATVQRIPLRVRFRRKGDVSWINCPELHVAAAEPALVRKAIKFVWTPRAETIIIPAVGFIAAHKSVPASGVDPFSGGWEAGSYFSAGPGSNALYSGSTGSSNVRNVTLEYNQATFHLDATAHPPGIYEIEVKRGCTIVNSSFSDAAYTYSSVVHDLFGYYRVAGICKIPRSRANLQERAYIARVASVWNEHPVQRGGTALIAIKAKNRSVDQLSCVASGYVPDWDGAGWNSWTVTKNPAPHMVDAMRWKHSLYKLPAELLDSSGLVAWRSRCITQGYECSAIFEGSSFTDGARIIASCGYARPYASDKYGVIEDYDRSAETPTQIFTPRNTADFSIDKAFARLPDGFRLRYTDEDASYIETEEIVLRDDLANGTNLEQITYEGITSRDRAIERATFDLSQARKRSTFYSFKTPAEYIVARRGDLVGLSYDEFGRMFGQARIVAVERNESDLVSGLFLDSQIPIYNDPYLQDVPVLQDIQIMQLVGFRTSFAARRNDMTVTPAYTLSTSTGQTEYIQFSSPFLDDKIEDGCLAVVGSVDSVYKRAIVTNISPSSDLTALITCVDEAPELHV